MVLPSVSLVLATWSGGGYLRRLARFLGQTVLPKELIVSDGEIQRPDGEHPAEIRALRPVPGRYLAAAGAGQVRAEFRR